ncbi:MAG: two-component system response regulator [Gallionellales bacterium RIFCSPLOWO2_12_FULL_59_22]|nr:MAG: two-component system response regulator [Gallionellales bacterium RIFCSPLOWO2_02_FULL_59_110]OGT05236.1 MAG: two-component system response regulator [Gallionellales bacterium RIFCSPLOWO2_02_58_13]OGT10043.1 MAG: two-component system response regulator [Gallionellales bacterium RIFCSPLOWO2_12_FULL_59_22]
MSAEGEFDPAAGAEKLPRILVVDDEAFILSSLQRLLRNSGFEVLTADSGTAGLAVLERETIDVVISDMRMPGMTGAEFLEQTFSRWPNVKRILLTGYADVASTIAAVNKGKIWRYIAKPWDDEDLLLTVQQAAAHRNLMNENACLLAIVQEQNAQLKSLNVSLEAKVDERTRQLQQTLKTLRQSFVDTVNVFSNMMEMRGGVLAGHSRRVADLARKVALKSGMDEAGVQETFLAALLHDIGKLGLSDEAFEQPFNALGPALRAEVMKHPARGEMLLMPIQQLAGVAALVRHHHEQFDGHGYPGGISGMEIPLGARILAAANDFDALQIGMMTARRFNRIDALHYLVENRGKRYDPSVVDALGAVLAEAESKEFVEMPLRPVSLQPGMRLARDLVHQEGYLLLARDHVLTAAEIGQLARLEASDGHPLTLYISQ